MSSFKAPVQFDLSVIFVINLLFSVNKALNFDVPKKKNKKGESRR